MERGNQKTFPDFKLDMEQFSKEDYNKIVVEQRKMFVHEYFGKTVNDAFKRLKEEALKMRNCHTEVTFEIPDHFDIYKTAELIRHYFSDLGYDPVGEPIKVGTTTVTFTLT